MYYFFLFFRYVSSIDNEVDLTEYMKTLIDFNNSEHKNFFSEFIRLKFPIKGHVHFFINV